MQLGHMIFLSDSEQAVCEEEFQLTIFISIGSSLEACNDQVKWRLRYVPILVNEGVSVDNPDKLNKEWITVVGQCN